MFTATKMAPYALLLVMFLPFANSQQIQATAINYVTDIDKESCLTEEDGFPRYFDSASMTCEKCSGNNTEQRTTADGLSCECQPGFKYTRNFGGSQVSCEPCGVNEEVSEDGWECKTCAVDSNQATCRCEADRTITAERQLNGLWASSPQTDLCVLCEGNTVPNESGDRCVRCTDDLKLGFTDCQSPCPQGQQAGGFCFPSTVTLSPPDTRSELFEIPRIDGTSSTTSLYFETHLRAAYTMCTNQQYQNATACQVVANLCALTLYNEGPNRICYYIRTEREAEDISLLLYYSDDADEIVDSTDIPDSFTFDPPTTIPFEAAVHSLDGTYLGNVDLTDGLLQLCETTESVANAAYIFGTYYSYSCSIKAKRLWDRVKYPLVFYDIYLRYREGEEDRLYKIPLNILDLRDGGDDAINTGDIQEWEMTRRMFLVDNQMEISSTSDADDSQEVTYVRYAKDITLNIALQPDTADGKIKVPYFTIKYGEVSLKDANDNATVDISFTTTYTMSWGNYRRNFQIASGTLGTLATLYAGYRTWVWSKRAGRPSIDFPSIMNFIFFLAGSLSNTFFVITFGIAFYWFIFYKVFTVCFFLVVVGFENTTTQDPDGSVEKASGSYQAKQSYIYRYALAALVYMVVGVVQWVFFTFIYERFVEDKIQQFVDLCSMSNISVFVMAHAQFGYYIHGRSVHGKSDTDMREMAEMMKREEEDLCGKRGLVPDTEEQTFIMSLPRRLRIKYEQVYLPAALENAGAVSRMEQGKAGNRLTGSPKEKSIEAYSMLNKFLCGFIDHSLRDVDYVVKDKTLLESIMDTEFFDTTEKGIFYKDNGHSFDQVLFYGNEISLLLFDMLLFCMVDLIWQNYLLDGIIVFLVTNLVSMIRDTAGRKNLARKTLVDERFLI